MCGIAGIFSRRAPQPPALIRQMTGAIRHRGPDDDGFFEDTFCSLGHRRLSIIDVAGGRQPMFNEDDRLAIVYNGEIYNHRSLDVALLSEGHVYRSHCDTETIVHAYEQYGPDALNQLRGMFAFAIWDRGRKELFCARDRLGIKPFYYYSDSNIFLFASEIKAILEHPAVSSRIETEVLPEYLAFGYGSGEQTLFRRGTFCASRPSALSPKSASIGTFPSLLRRVNKATWTGSARPARASMKWWSRT